MHLDPLLAADLPRWIWATLLMVAFVGLTLVTIALVRYPVRRVSPAPSQDEGAPTETS
jgi:hypothetical protein